MNLYNLNPTFLILFIFIIGKHISFSKENIQIHIDSSPQSKTLSFKNCFKKNSSDLPLYLYQSNTSYENFRAEITNTIYKRISKIPYQEMPNTLVIETYNSYYRKEQINNVLINPYRLNGNELEFLISFDIEIIPINSSNRFSETEIDYAANSVLATGNWYQFTVDKAAIYKLDYNFLSQLGVAVNTINPSNIKIFGNEGGMLPELAGVNRIDDLKEYPIKVVTANTGSFGTTDYILVYCPGPNSWSYNTSRQQFKVNKHLYSQTQHLFLTTDLGAGTQVGIIPNSLTENHTTTNYDAFDFFETENENIAISGRIFLGDRFIDKTSKSYSFNFPNIISSIPIRIWSNFVAASSSSSSITITDNSGNTRTQNISPLLQEYPGIFSTGSVSETNFSFSNPTENPKIIYTFQGNESEAKGYLDFLNIQARCKLTYNGTPLYFRDIQTVASGRITKFSIANANSNILIWDVTNPFQIKQLNYTQSGTTASFIVPTDTLKEFVVFEPNKVTATPTKIGKVTNQNLHSISAQDLIIITRNKLLPYAEQLAQLHRDYDNLRTIVVTYEQLINEFAAGTNDITAIRNFVKFFYDNATTTNDLPKYLLLFGDGTYDNKNLGEYYLPTYQSKQTYRSLETFTTDDYFGILDNNEGNSIENTSIDVIDIGVGRIPADNEEKAALFVEKIKNYYSSNDFGDWRSQITFIADDEDNNLHLTQTDNIANTLSNSMQKFNIDKIYLDAYSQQVSISGASYPDVNNAIYNKLNTGTLLVNYVGHGGGTGLAQEAIVTLNEIERWNNPNKLPLFVTATCEFSRFDEYDKYSAGERVIFKDNSGGIGLLTTTRLVFANENFEMNKNFMQQFIQGSTNSSIKLGDMLMNAKRNTFTGDGNRKFLLLGDPALTVAFPKYNTVITSINNHITDTLKSLKSITLKGEVRDNSNTLMSNFNGTATIVVYDKVKTLQTLANDPQSNVANFQLQKNRIFKGRTQVLNGLFQVTFIVPKDIDYLFGKGKISVYANSTTTDALGFDTSIIVGGVDTTTINDNKGPDVLVFMNDDNFVFGGITNENPTILLKLFDENGINTSGNGIGHDLTAILDNNTKDIFILNDYYETEINNVQNGTATYPLSKLSKGRHTLNIRAWDILNNSGDGYTEFIVEDDAKLALSHVLNYPNPFTTHTTFMFEHNKPNQPLQVKIELFSVSGKVVKTIEQDINSDGFRVADIIWDGKDEFGDNIGRGVYIYRITLKDSNGNKNSQYQKLVLLK